MDSGPPGVRDPRGRTGRKQRDQQLEAGTMVTSTEFMENLQKIRRADLKTAARVGACPVGGHL